MVKVTCTLPNASTNINGVTFEKTEAGMVATVEADVAKQFDGIPGYTLQDEDSNSGDPKKVDGDQGNSGSGTLSIKKGAK